MLRPLQAELIAGRRQWVCAMDALLDRRNWTQAERGTLRELLCDAAGELLAARGEDAALKALYDGALPAVDPDTMTSMPGVRVP